MKISSSRYSGLLLSIRQNLISWDNIFIRKSICVYGQKMCFMMSAISGVDSSSYFYCF